MKKSSKISNKKTSKANSKINSKTSNKKTSKINSKIKYLKKGKKSKKKYYSNIKGGTIIMFVINKKDDNTIDYQSNKSRCMCIDHSQDEMGNNNVLNNGRRCNHQAENGSQFCKRHRNCMSFLRTFTSGDEPQYNVSKWSHPYVEGSLNCYSYFLDDQPQAIINKCKSLCEKKHKSGCPKKTKACSKLKPQPENYHLLLRDGNLGNKSKNYKCPVMERKIMNDNRSLQKTDFLSKCPKQHYKGAMVIDPDHTFHFYRQNPNGYWSHKPGILKVSDTDATGQKIPVPHFASRNYEKGKSDDINYTDFCGYYCIPTNKYKKTYVS